MVNGLYTASRGMSNIIAKQDVNSQNLANVNTTGFKLARLINRTEVSVGRDDEGQLRQREFQTLSELHTSFEPGPMVKTGNPFDMAIKGKGFFQIDSEDGPRYTRNGAFSMNGYGELVTLGGRRVLDEEGAPIVFENQNAQITLQDDGGLYSDGKKLGRIAVVDFPQRNQLKYTADGLFSNPDPDGNAPIPVTGAAIGQGFLEGSNVDPVSTMVNIIADMRNYEADQKAIHAIDETLGKAVNEVGRV